MMGDSRGALGACAKGLELDPNDAELWFCKGLVYRQWSESSEDEKCWRLILSLKRPDQFCNVDQNIYGHLTRRKLGNPGRRAWRSCRSATAVGSGAGRMPWQSRSISQAPASGAETVNDDHIRQG
jgi:hypothetical protein